MSYIPPSALHQSSPNANYSPPCSSFYTKSVSTLTKQAASSSTYRHGLHHTRSLPHVQLRALAHDHHARRLHSHSSGDFKHGVGRRSFGQSVEWRVSRGVASCRSPKRHRGMSGHQKLSEVVARQKRRAANGRAPPGADKAQSNHRQPHTCTSSPLPPSPPPLPAIEPAPAQRRTH